MEYREKETRMWIMLDTGFISIVEHNDNPDVLLVRARVREDIALTFGDDIEIEEMPGADYLYRASVDREEVAELIWHKVMSLDYTSHAKDVALKRSSPAEGRRAAYYDTWSAMGRMQPIPPYQKTAARPFVDSQSFDDWLFERDEPSIAEVLDRDEDWSGWYDSRRSGSFALEDDGHGGVRTIFP